MESGGKPLPPEEKFLEPEEEKTLLRLARYVLERFVGEKIDRFPTEVLGDFTITPALQRPSGVFVTLSRKGRLRGCIGNILPSEPLVRGVIENTMHSAAHDPRFNPMGPDELKSTGIEISIMSPLMKVHSLDEVEVGRDGLVLSAGRRKGVFLPQVPVEWNWDKTQYLEELGLKAGLERDAYRRKDAEMWRFTAQVFSESNP
jgi:AmmeMemoRadiSam system protein A